MTYVGKDSEDHTNTYSHTEVMEIREKEGKNTQQIPLKLLKDFQIDNSFSFYILI